jgi:uncharacterized membrane protein/predicted DsbA family dithiol-disulfide isomerase
MTPRIPLAVLRLALLVALAVSTALLVDYLRPVPAFCAMGSGCTAVRASDLSHPFGVPLPLLGVVSFAALLAISLAAQADLRKLLGVLVIGGGVIGFTLFLVQAFVLHVFCVLCLWVDASSVIAAAAVLTARRMFFGNEPWPPTRGWELGFFIPAALLAMVAPIGWSLFQPAPPVPREIAAFWVAGKINVVEFADFECPYCRQLHPEMKEVLADYSGRVHFTRLNMPLPSHPHARDAARAYLCGEEQGKADAMADALFTSDDLTAAGNRKTAEAIGLAMAAYDRCIVDPATVRKLEAEIGTVRATGFRGLPTVWINDQIVVGLQPVDVLREAFERAEHQSTAARQSTSDRVLL